MAVENEYKQDFRTRAQQNAKDFIAVSKQS